MKWLRFARLMASFLQASFILTAILTSERAFAQTGSANLASSTQTLFTCHTDLIRTLRKLSDGSYEVSGRRSIRGEVRLTIEADTHSMRLLVRSQGETARAYVLSDVEQGSSLGSGASGRADTTIRGKGGGKVFTLFAGYENNVEDHASLEVAGSNTLLLLCRGAQFSAPGARGVGRHGGTNIYTLSYDGLAREMTVLPDEPDR